MSAHWYNQQTANWLIVCSTFVLLGLIMLAGWLAFLRAKQGRKA